MKMMNSIHKMQKRSGTASHAIAVTRSRTRLNTNKMSTTNARTWNAITTEAAAYTNKMSSPNALSWNALTTATAASALYQVKD